MNDELERLKKALRATSPRPPEAARKHAIAEARSAFKKHHQGNSVGVRQTRQEVKTIMSWLKKSIHPFPSPYAVIACGACLAVVAIGITYWLPTSSRLSENAIQTTALAPEASVEPTLSESASLSQTAKEAATDPAPATPTPVNPPGLRSNRPTLPSVKEMAVPDMIPMPPADWSGAGERFAHFDPNPVKLVSEEPVSTFSIDVDTASYSFMRASLLEGVLPPKESVRVEELINYFSYDYPTPSEPTTPFATRVTMMPTPWNSGTRLMHIGIRGFTPTGPSPRANLVFLIDTSGSMRSANKLPLVINSLRLLLAALSPADTVAIVTYAGSAGTVLKPTAVAKKAEILSSLDRLSAGGATAGAQGIHRAYQLAEENFIQDGINRVILATDGDFNVGVTDPAKLKSYIERKRESGVLLSVLGFGRGNLNDRLMQALAQSGNGVAAYIDTLSEARKVLVEEATSTLFPIAKDVKLQVEFNPELVSEYRLIGYETRLLAREEFRNDAVDAGEIGAGHKVTAIYEFTPVGSGAELIPPLRYQRKVEAPASKTRTGEYAFIKIRYKLPQGKKSTLISRPVTGADDHARIEDAPQEVRFAAAVAAFGQLLRGGRYTGSFDYDEVLTLAEGGRGRDRFGYRSEFLQLVRLAKSAAMVARPQ